MKQPKLVLASTSRYRRDLMDRLGLDYESVPHLVDEDEFKVEGQDPESLARTLSIAKAASLRQRFPDAFILGSDQVAVLAGQILSKPGTVDKAEAQLQRLRGQTHTLLTGLALDCPGGDSWADVDRIDLRMRPLTDAEISRYIAADQPLDCCGSYRIESRGITLFEAIDGSDFTAIIGLGLIRVTTLLRRAGFLLP
jgi:septum formation protein